MPQDSSLVVELPGRGRTARRGLLGGVVLLVGALIWGAWWWSHPSIFVAAPDTWSVGGGETMPADGEPLHVRMAWTTATDGSVNLAEAAPHVLVNTAGAELTTHVCRVAGEGSFSSVLGDLDDYCSELTPVDGAVLSLPEESSRQQVVMTITAAHPGVLGVQGLDLTYRDGAQYGTQRVGEHVWIRFD